MNALATDQANRLNDYLHKTGLEQVTAGLYIGDTPEIGYPRVMTDRAEIRFHDLRHGAATLVLLGKVDVKVISEALGHSRHSFTADTCTSVLPEVSRAAAEAVAAVVPRMSADDVTDEQATSVPPNVISLADRRRSRIEHAG
ncbi:hypothetical protein [Actinomadura sp. GTD37]|uniref:hypothetical protein n=1 Tax=Actinomadura sp. GTD37 TaxID=1778030 RepID=UPI0035C19887